MVVHEAGLLEHQTPAGEDGKVWDPTNIESPRELRVLFGIDFQDYSFASHVRGGYGYFRRCDAAGPTPIRPEIDKNWNGRGLNHFIE
jgi:hypothetical protein